MIYIMYTCTQKRQGRDWSIRLGEDYLWLVGTSCGKMSIVKVVFFEPPENCRNASTMSKIPSQRQNVHLLPANSLLP